MGNAQQTSNVPNAHDSGANRSPSLVLIASMADTTWRMFVPTIPLIVLGNWLDGQWHTKPWLLLAGAVVGGAIAAGLIRAQLRRHA